MTANGQNLGVTTKEQPAAASTSIAASIATLLAVAVIAFVVAAPFAWLVMLFLGNLGRTDMGFWACLPGGGLVGALVAGRVKS